MFYSKSAQTVDKSLPACLYRACLPACLPACLYRACLPARFKISRTVYSHQFNATARAWLPGETSLKTLIYAPWLSNVHHGAIMCTMVQEFAPWCLNGHHGAWMCTMVQECAPWFKNVHHGARMCTVVVRHCSGTLTNKSCEQEWAISPRARWHIHTDAHTHARTHACPLSLTPTGTYTLAHTHTFIHI